MGFAERQGDFQVEPFHPTPDDVLASLGLEPGLDQAELQAGLVDRWDQLSDRERELVSEAGYV
jgi:hypothetical protein